MKSNPINFYKQQYQTVRAQAQVQKQDKKEKAIEISDKEE